MTSLIQAQALRFDLDFPALTIDIPKGALSFVLGPTGSGKSKLLLTLAGVTRAQAGEVLLNGQDPFAGDEKEWLSRRPDIGYVLPSRTLVSHLTIIQNIMLPLNYHRTSTPAQALKLARQMVERLGIQCDTTQLPAVCLEADRRLITLARALMLKPSTLFVDQAFAHLDAYGRQHFVSMYAELIAELNLSLILASKDLLAVAKLAEVADCQQRFIFLTNTDILCFDSWNSLASSQHTDLANYLKLHLPEHFLQSGVN